jgi:hypothetical protein
MPRTVGVAGAAAWVRWDVGQRAGVAFDHEVLDVDAPKLGEHELQRLPDHLLRLRGAGGQKLALHRQDRLVGGIRPIVTRYGMEEAAVTTEGQDRGAEQVACDLLASAVQEAEGLAEDQVELARVLVLQRQRDQRATRLDSYRLIQRAAREALVRTQAPSVRRQKQVQFFDVRHGLLDVGRHFRMDHPCQKGEQYLVRSVGELQAGVLEDPVVGQVLVVEPVLLDIGADSRKLAVADWRSVEVVEALQERDLVHFAPPGARYPAQVLEDVTSCHRRDCRRLVRSGGIGGSHVSRMDD